MSVAMLPDEWLQNFGLRTEDSRLQLLSEVFQFLLLAGQGLFDVFDFGQAGMLAFAQTTLLCCLVHLKGGLVWACVRQGHLILSICQLDLALSQHVFNPHHWQFPKGAHDVVVGRLFVEQSFGLDPDQCCLRQPVGEKAQHHRSLAGSTDWKAWVVSIKNKRTLRDRIILAKDGAKLGRVRLGQARRIGQIIDRHVVDEAVLRLILFHCGLWTVDCRRLRRGLRDKIAQHLGEKRARPELKKISDCLVCISFLNI